MFNVANRTWRFCSMMLIWWCNNKLTSLHLDACSCTSHTEYQSLIIVWSSWSLIASSGPVIVLYKTVICKYPDVFGVLLPYSCKKKPNNILFYFYFYLSSGTYYICSTLIDRLQVCGVNDSLPAYSPKVQGNNVTRAPFLNAYFYISAILMESKRSELKILQCYTPSHRFCAALPKLWGREKERQRHPRQCKVVCLLHAGGRRRRKFRKNNKEEVNQSIGCRECWVRICARSENEVSWQKLPLNAKEIFMVSPHAALFTNTASQTNTLLEHIWASYWRRTAVALTVLHGTTKMESNVLYHVIRRLARRIRTVRTSMSVRLDIHIPIHCDIWYGPARSLTDSLTHSLAQIAMNARFCSS